MAESVRERRYWARRMFSSATAAIFSNSSAVRASTALSADVSNRPEWVGQGGAWNKRNSDGGVCPCVRTIILQAPRLNSLQKHLFIPDNKLEALRFHQIDLLGMQTAEENPTNSVLPVSIQLPRIDAAVM